MRKTIVETLDDEKKDKLIERHSENASSQKWYKEDF